MDLIPTCLAACIDTWGSDVVHADRTFIIVVSAGLWKVLKGVLSGEGFTFASTGWECYRRSLSSRPSKNRARSRRLRIRLSKTRTARQRYHRDRGSWVSFSAWRHWITISSRCRNGLSSPRTCSRCLRTVEVSVDWLLLSAWCTRWPQICMPTRYRDGMSLPEDAIVEGGRSRYISSLLDSTRASDAVEDLLRSSLRPS